MRAEKVSLAVFLLAIVTSCDVGHLEDTETGRAAVVTINDTCPDGSGSMLVYQVVETDPDPSDNRSEVPTLSQVPWNALGLAPNPPMTTVCIYPKADGSTYSEIIVVNRSAAANSLSDLTIRGIPTSAGARPRIDGNNAGCNVGASSATGAGAISLRAVSGAAISNVTIENLEIAGARAANTKSNCAGGTENFQQDAAAIATENVDGIVIRNNVLRDSANGINTNPNDEQITIEGNYFVNNGFYDGGPDPVHHAYLEGQSAIVRYNYFGELCSGASGGCSAGTGTLNLLKMRTVTKPSIGTPQIVAYNWFDGSSSYALDIIEPGGDSAAECQAFGVGEPTDVTNAYGNVITRPVGSAYSQNALVHFGGEGPCSDAHGVHRYKLNFYNNTVTSHETGQFGLRLARRRPPSRCGIRSSRASTVARSTSRRRLPRPTSG